MEILYLTAVLAVIALSIVLFSTTRRILHPNPLTAGGDMSLTQVERLTQSWEPIAQSSYEETMLSHDETETQDIHEDLKEENLNMDEYLLPQVTRVAAVQQETFAAPAAEIPAPEPAKDAYFDAISEPQNIHLQPESLIQEKMDVQPQVYREDWMRAKPESALEKTAGPSSPRSPHYLLECLLLGVSVLVLVKTQKSTSQYRTEHASNRVA